MSKVYNNKRLHMINAFFPSFFSGCNFSWPKRGNMVGLRTGERISYALIMSVTYIRFGVRFAVRPTSGALRRDAPRRRTQRVHVVRRRRRNYERFVREVAESPRGAKRDATAKRFPRRAAVDTQVSFEKLPLLEKCYREHSYGIPVSIVSSHIRYKLIDKQKTKE